MSISRHAIAEWESNPAPEAPTAPETLKEAGITAKQELFMVERL